MENADTVGDAHEGPPQTWPDRYPFVGDVRGKGLMLAIESWSRPRPPRARPRALRDRIVDEAFNNGLLLLGAGPTAIRFCPPLNIDIDTVNAGLDVMERVMDGMNSKFAGNKKMSAGQRSFFCFQFSTYLPVY